MEALEFLKERKRMCRSFGGSCTGCPCEKVRCVINAHVSDDDYKRIVAMVEEWSAAHPRKTRQSVVLEQFPNVMLDTNGIIDISSCRVDPKQYPFNGKDCCKFRSCGECRHEFWMQEVE